MAVKKRRSVKVKGVAKAAPNSSGGIKKRTSFPIAPETPTFGGELGSVIAALTDSGKYGTAPFKKGSSKAMDRQRSRSGVLTLDLCLGGGWAQSAAGMLYGEKSSGKTTLALQSIAAHQQRYDQAVAAWLDIEGTLDKHWARKLGVDLDRLVVVEPETGEHAVDLADAMLRSREITHCVTDSIAMLVPMKELDESAEQETMGIQARLVGKYIRKTNNAILRERQRGHEPILIHINQFRMKIGLVFGDPRTLPGGKALEFSTTQQVETKNKEHLGKDEEKNDIVIFNEHNFKITKNKGGGPMKEGAFKLIRGQGTVGKEQYDLPEAWVDQAKTIYKFGTQIGLVTGAPSSFEIEGYGKFRGAPAFNAWAIENPLPYDEVQALIVAGFRDKWSLD